jgi:hypothetical protein
MKYERVPLMLSVWYKVLRIKGKIEREKNMAPQNTEVK